VGKVVLEISPGGDVLEVGQRAVAINITIKIITSFALAAAGAFPPAAFGVSAGNVIFEGAMAAVLEGLALYAGTAVGLGAAFAGSETGEGMGWVIFFTYPVAASVGVFAAGEGTDGPSENAGAVFGYTTLAAYGQLGAFLGGAALYDAATDYAYDEPYEKAIFADAALKPVTVTLVYNLVKKPVKPPPSETLLPSLEPYAAVAASTNNTPVPLYGLTISF
jgi:hypothetical protein